MVIKKDPYAILEMLSRPVPVDEDTEFLDKVEKKTSFHDLPNKPPEDLSKLDPVLNAEQEAMLRSLADAEIDEDEVVLERPKPEPQEPQELDSKHRRFFNLFQGVSTTKGRSGATLPENIDFKKIHAEVEAALPEVADTEEEKEAKREDLERRTAYLEAQAKKDAAMPQKSHAEYDKNHDSFLAQFDTVLEDR